jgi:hypothetical protein
VLKKQPNPRNRRRCQAGGIQRLRRNSAAD